MLFALSEEISIDGAEHNKIDEIVFGVIIGTGVEKGGLVVINNKIKNGHNNITEKNGDIIKCQFDQMTEGTNELKWKRHDCYCGKKGCIETFLSGPGFSKHFYDIHKIDLDAKIMEK